MSQKKIPFAKFLHCSDCKRGDFVWWNSDAEFKFAVSFESSKFNLIARLGR